MAVVKLVREVAVLVRSCNVSGAIDTKVFSSVESAKFHCENEFNVPSFDWYGYEVEYVENSEIKLNGKPVRYTGWKKELADSDLDIQLRKMTIEMLNP